MLHVGNDVNRAQKFFELSERTLLWRGLHGLLAILIAGIQSRDELDRPLTWTMVLKRRA